jgi:cytosine permease
VPATLVVWVAASLIGEYVHWGIPALNALVVSVVGYVAAGQLGLTKGFGQDSGKAEACASA